MTDGKTKSLARASDAPSIPMSQACATSCRVLRKGHSGTNGNVHGYYISLVCGGQTWGWPFCTGMCSSGGTGFDCGVEAMSSVSLFSRGRIDLPII